MKINEIINESLVESVEEGMDSDIQTGDFVKDRSGVVYRVFGVSGTNLSVAKYYGDEKYSGTQNVHVTKAHKIEQPVDEGSMTAAAKNPSGPKFGGYYGATQKGAPKKNQGFGAAESVGSKLSEVAPPGMEDVVLKLKKQYPGEPQKAFATAWSMYNKNKGKK